MWKKNIIILITFLSIFGLSSVEIFAEETNGSADPASSETKNEPSSDFKGETNFKEMTFDVSQNLSLDEKDQGMSYFKDDQHSPAVSLVLTAIRFATRIIGALAMLLLIIGGFYLITSQGDDAGITKGKDILKYAIMGIVIVFLSYLIMTFVQSFFIK